MQIAIFVLTVALIVWHIRTGYLLVGILVGAALLVVQTVLGIMAMLTTTDPTYQTTFEITVAQNVVAGQWWTIGIGAVMLFFRRRAQARRTEQDLDRDASWIKEMQRRTSN